MCIRSPAGAVLCVPGCADGSPMTENWTCISRESMPVQRRRGGAGLQRRSLNVGIPRRLGDASSPCQPGGLPRFKRGCEVEGWSSGILHLLRHTRLCTAAPRSRSRCLLNENLTFADTTVSEGAASRSCHNAAGQEAQHGAGRTGCHRDFCGSFHLKRSLPGT